MAAPLEYDFRVIGRAVVEREIAALEKRFIASAARLNREFNKLATGGTGRTSGGGASTSRNNGGLFAPGHKEYIAQQRLNHRQSLRDIKERERAAVNAVRGERKQVDDVNRSRQSIHNQRLREEKQQRIESTKTNAQRQREIDRQSSSQQALARQRRSEEAAHKNLTKSRVDFIKSTVSGGVGRVANAIGSVGRLGLSVAGIGASALAASSISQAISLDETSRRLSIAGRNPGEKGVDPGMLSKEFTKTGIKTGFSPEAIASGVRSYVAKTGDLNTAMVNKDMFATVAQGGDTDVTDIFNMAADMKSKLKLGTPEEMKEAFAIFSQQGKKGKFELKNMAVEMPQILSNAANAGMRGVGGARDVGAMMQMAMDATGNGSEATTAVLNMMKSFPQHAKDFQSGKAFGGRKVQIYEGGDSKNPMRNLGDIMAESISASRGDMGAIYKKFGIRGKKALDPMMNAYKEAYHATKGTEAQKDAAGKAATKAEFGKYRNLPADFKDVELDAQDAMKSFSVQMEIINTKLKDAIASQLFPEIVKLLPELEKLIPYVADATKAFINLVKYIANDPMGAVFKALAASIAYEMAKVGLGKLVTGGLTSVMSRIPAISGAAGGVGGMGGAAGGMGIAARLAGGAIGGAAGYFGGGAAAKALGGSESTQSMVAFGLGGAGAAAGAGLGVLGAEIGLFVGLVADQANKLKNENGGWDFWNGDDKLNAAAKAEANERSSKALSDSFSRETNNSLANIAIQDDKDTAYGKALREGKTQTEAMAEYKASGGGTVIDTISAQKEANAEVAKFAELLKTVDLTGLKPNTGDKPSPIK